MLEQDHFNEDLYKRHNIETILRISLKRAVDPLVANYWASRDSKLCKEWGLYGAEEGRHDRMFARDLHAIGMTDEEIYSTRPTFATELLNGYFYYTLATEGPLASMISGFYLEFVAGKTQPDWLDVMERHLDPSLTRGARAHLSQDLEDDHVNMVWNMIMNVVKTAEDEERFIEHLIKINALFVSYFVEVYTTTAMANARAEERAMVAPVAAVKTAVEVQASLAGAR
jgi:pyrroloquinoline quinone (PQQ) biosynthesis protein C